MDIISNNKASQLGQDQEKEEQDEEMEYKEEGRGDEEEEVNETYDEASSSLDEDEAEDEDEGECGRPALAIDSTQLSGKGVGVPQNGHDYLRLVQEERDKYPAVLSSRPAAKCVSDDEDDESVTTSSVVMEGGELAPEQQPQQLEENNGAEAEQDKGVRSAHLKELDCVEEILVNFKELRKQIECLRASSTLDEAAVAAPISEQEFKRQTSSGESARRVNNLVKLMELGQPPQVSSLIDKNQLEIHMTLERLADQCELLPKYSTSHNDWIYSLMACLREPIEPDICSSLRRLARLCASSPGQLPDSSSLLIICIVRHYFGQTDLKYSGAHLKRLPAATIRHDPALPECWPTRGHQHQTNTKSNSKPKSKTKTNVAATTMKA